MKPTTLHIGQEYATRDGRLVEYMGRTSSGKLEVKHLVGIDGPDGVDVTPGATLLVNDLFVIGA